MSALPTINWNGKNWFVYLTLNQIRNVENPHEFHDITELGLAVQVALGLRDFAAGTTPRFASPDLPPRKKHSHRCLRCGSAVYCYKSRCTLPQRITTCRWCR